MAELERKLMRRSLKDKGFKPEEKGNHTIWFYWRVNPDTGQELKTAAHCVISRGSGYRTYPDYLMAPIRRQLKLSSVNLAKQLLDCRMDQPAYERQISSTLGF